MVEVSFLLIYNFHRATTLRFYISAVEMVLSTGKDRHCKFPSVEASSTNIEILQQKDKCVAKLNPLGDI